MLEMGSAPVKNTQNVLMKNVLDICVSAMAWWATGWALAFGENTAGGTFGASGFFYADVRFAWSWFLQYCFAANAATIFGGALQGRTKFAIFLLVSFVTSSVVYPVVAHWTWGGGWLATMGANGAIDFSGSCVVHGVGGAVALVGAIMTGPRRGRFDEDGTVVPMPGHNQLLATTGVLILWAGWFAFNFVSVAALKGGNQAIVAGHIAYTTCLAGSAAALASFATRRIAGEPYSLSELSNAVLGGLVAITGSCNVVTGYAAVIIGAVAAFVYESSARLLLRLKIDDAIGAAPVHLFCGVWGMISVGLFATEEFVELSYPGRAYAAYGLLYGGGAEQLGIQLLTCVCALTWTSVWIVALFWVCRRLNIVRVTYETEVGGLDVVKHDNESAFPEYVLVGQQDYKGRVPGENPGLTASGRAEEMPDGMAVITPVLVEGVDLGGLRDAGAVEMSDAGAEVQHVDELDGDRLVEETDGRDEAKDI